MPPVQKLRTLLDSRKIPYSLTSHRPATRASELAYVEHLPAWEVAKCVVVYGNNSYSIIAVPADRFVDLFDVASALNVPWVRLATEDELAHLFPDCELGAMPPIGTLYDLPVYLDADLASETMITFPAGTHSQCVHMRMDDLRKLTAPKILPISRLHAVAAH
jgi:Ala-tRNA(Pro) deacylase